MIWVSY